MSGYSYKASDYVADANTSYLTVDSMPKPSDWQCRLIDGPNGVTYTPTKGNEPNWFHRKMQELCFGFKWRKKK